LIFHNEPEIANKSFTEFLSKDSKLNLVANFSMIALVLVSNIYNTTPNKQIVISFFMRNEEMHIEEENDKNLNIKKNISEDEKEEKYFYDIVSDNNPNEDDDSSLLVKKNNQDLSSDQTVKDIQNKGIF
jgi:hypothetical protein